MSQYAPFFPSSHRAPLFNCIDPQWRVAPSWLKLSAAHVLIMSKSELACVYSSLILASEGLEVTADKICTLLKAANIKFVERYLPELFANALQNVNITDLLTSVAGIGAPSAAAATAPAAAAPTAAPAAAPATEKEKPAEPEEESDDDMGFDLFG
ncbi:unnamed protein product [Dicrocoelium dendriticum]|nr:unnamed protein product [Dicrocoelium dendriticum]